MKEENKCEKMGIAHAWRYNQSYLSSQSSFEQCANCDLKRTYCSETKEWWSYSDGRPNEEIINIRPV